MTEQTKLIDMALGIAGNVYETYICEISETTRETVFEKHHDMDFPIKFKDGSEKKLRFDIVDKDYMFDMNDVENTDNLKKLMGSMLQYLRLINLFTQHFIEETNTSSRFRYFDRIYDKKIKIDMNNTTAYLSEDYPRRIGFVFY